MAEADYSRLPADLPVPVDDGACAHLPGTLLPAVLLPSTTGTAIELARWPGRLVVYCYPMTGQPGVPLPPGWDTIPGARGCTPQACAFRDHYAELRALGVEVFGLSTQDTASQREARERLHLPFPLLSDHQLHFARALRLPTFEVEGRAFLKRLTLIARNGRIEHVFYPVFPPNQNAEQVVQWLREHP